MKRKTKDQREQKQRDALYQRVCDIMAGACSGSESWQKDWYAEASCLPAIARAVETRLLPNGHAPALTAIYNTLKYDSAANLTDFLFRNGIRA